MWGGVSGGLTDNHDVKVEALADTLAVPLVGQIGETDVAGQLAANDVLHIGSGLGDGLGVLGANRLGVSGAHGIAAFNERGADGAGGRGFGTRHRGAIGRRRRSWKSHGCVSDGIEILSTRRMNGRRVIGWFRDGRGDLDLHGVLERGKRGDIAVIEQVDTRTLMDALGHNWGWDNAREFGGEMTGNRLGRQWRWQRRDDGSIEIEERDETDLPIAGGYGWWKRAWR